MNARQKIVCSSVGLLFVVAASQADSAFAQSASQITPRTFAPPIEGPLGNAGLSIGPQQGLDTPAGAEKLTITLSGVRVTGGFPELATAEAALRAKITGRTITGADIFAAARDLEAAYAKAGFVLARVALPPQQLVNGAMLDLVVVDGVIERIETKDAPGSVRPRIMDLLNPLIGVHRLTLAELERRVLLAGDIPGVLIRSTLAPGTTNGATVLVIEVRYQPVDGVLSFDNSLSPLLGTYQAGVGLDLNSVLGLGEFTYLRATGLPIGGSNGIFAHYARNRILAAGVIVPFAAIEGLSANVEGTEARTTPDPAGGLPSTDQFQRLSLRLRYAAIRSRELNLSTQLAFDAQDERQSLLGSSVLPLSDDRLRILRLTNNADYLSPWGGIFTTEFTVSFGLDAFGARTAAQATPTLPLSRQFADASFYKLDGALGYSQNVATHLRADLSVRGQTSFGSAMERAEQIGIAGPSALSGFDTGTLVGDSGFVVRGELGSPFILPPLVETVGLLVTPYVFGAGGAVFLSHPTALEASRIRAASYGLGVRLGGSKVGALSTGNIAVEYARGSRSDTSSNSNRFNLIANVKF